MQNRRKIPFVGLYPGDRKPTSSAGLYPVTLLVWAIWAVEKQNLFVCAVGAFWDLPQPVPRGRPWGKASCDRNKEFQKEGT